MTFVPTGHAWISDYGCADKEEDFPVLYAYSPIHNVRVPEGGTRQYPAFLITTGTKALSAVGIVFIVIFIIISNC